MSKYIRWRRRRQGTSAVLVESHREGHKVRQKHIAWIATINRDGIRFRGARARFWETALRKLDALALDAGDREKVIRQLSAVVPVEL